MKMNNFRWPDQTINLSDEAKIADCDIGFYLHTLVQGRWVASEIVGKHKGKYVAYIIDTGEYKAVEYKISNRCKE